MVQPADALGDARDLEVRERIFASALRHFSQKGYAATSLREIAEDAHTTKPMIYYYFGSKEGLYGHIVRELLQEMEAAIRSALPDDSSPTDQVLRYSERYLDYFLNNEEVIALVLREVFGLGGTPLFTFSQALAERVRKPLDEILTRGIGLGLFPKADVGALATAITGILNMFILAHVFGGAPIDRETPLHHVAIFMRGLERSAE